jgi:phosphoglycerate kinase
MPKLSIKDLDLQNKRVFMRVDFNVPLTDDGSEITDDNRIRATLPSIQYALEHNARLILATHLGRPKGKVNPKYSMKPVAARLASLLEEKLGKKVEVTFATDCIGDEPKKLTEALKPGSILLLENLRYHAEEEKNDPEFSKELAALCDVYVNDAFGSAHRAHASTEGITHFVKQSAAGLLMDKELNYMGKALEAPERPFVAILGGAKVSDKIQVIENLLGKVDALLIGGGMAYTFLKARGQETGKSLLEEDKIDTAKEALAAAAAKGVRFLLPVDHILADKFAADAATQVFEGDGPFPADWMALDIGPKTIALFSKEIAAAKTIIWNGPMGVFEMPAFAVGTTKIAQAVADSSAISIIGGGDSVSAVKKAGVADKITHISTGGGASLEFLEGKKLPGVEALTDK